MNHFSDELNFEIKNEQIQFSIDGVSTNWMSQNDSFIKRIQIDEINPAFVKKHLAHEIEIKNVLDEGIILLNAEKYLKAIECFDEVLFYDSEYADALINKSYALKGQKHFVKALRLYKRFAKCGFSDVEYQKSLMKLANGERDNFSKLKRNIYAGDEFFFKNEFDKAIEYYNKALVDSSKFKEKILFKLLNKKATALLKLEKFDESLECFKKSLEVKPNDYAYFGEGCCEYELGIDLNDKFKKVLKTDKRRLLKQAVILNDVELFEEALDICEMLFENHFRVDDFYFKMLNVKIHALKGLNQDVSDVEEIFNRL